ncbi:hypothetical protein [Pseudodesulfovibrio sp. zrk46]|uniref:hypothetical protein n=1 Tax=Pseudodesulfovibrio sp. zrk46 TaxID=2725288 RepID=UPI001449AAE3|nr:hypothetical protein [Pseudodesulfovibrio sp. zrk46]QJB55635.1 hypothetical protein HFN16_04140 [Pseudodesulfovibrio sp. zrk46]
MFLNSAQSRHANALGWSPEKTFSVNITDVWISRDVQVSIGRQLNALCISYDLPYSMLREMLVQELFWHEESGRLGLSIEVRDSDVDSIYIEIPESHWGFREEQNATQ